MAPSICDASNVTYSSRYDDPGAHRLTKGPHAWSATPNSPWRCCNASNTQLSSPSSGQIPYSCLDAFWLLADNYNWCIVEDKGQDAIVFASMAVVIACLVAGRLQSLIILILGKLRLQYCHNSRLAMIDSQVRWLSITASCQAACNSGSLPAPSPVTAQALTAVHTTATEYAKQVALARFMRTLPKLLAFVQQVDC
jgi:hypothetical protein